VDPSPALPEISREIDRITLEINVTGHSDDWGLEEGGHIFSGLRSVILY
jgi:hypothetical protein